MQLVNGFKLMEYAKEKKLILPAFNTTNYELTAGIVKGYEAMGLGGYIAISSSNLKLSSPKIIANMVKAAMKDVSTPIALHLDHGKSFEDVKACIDAGFTSIMVDASHLPLEENIKEVKRTVEYCHFYGIPVEAELGAIGGKEDDHISEEDAKTNPEDVRSFVEQTQCDMLAVAIGNVHGMDLVPKLDFPLLEEIAEISSVPLVLHGGSGIPFNQVRRARENNLIKVNYGSDLRQAFIRTFGSAYEINHNEFDIMSLSKEAIINVEDRVKAIIREVNIH
ncbi:fructose-bisphosphate aldolase class II [Enterococcus sp. PF1-24]|uniref:class II aldolase n=1 Tax=unclassified Enterococcus TaxID=2608891 RepID=UPI00247540D2|nr:MULTISPECIES: class II aldolase [unclassified Enterococcus]MDH6365399.1 fructose-bisphosphate aldolase class II [Enterococcus sp. PFB1-1]MDH6402529.1 fructose-bisphosphate aldolase class II [Enterococcus sp. PF1-24]